MEFIFKLWSILAFSSGTVFYVSVIVAVILLEKHFIKKRSKGEVILPVVVLIAAMALIPVVWMGHAGRSSGLEPVQIFKGNHEVGHLLVVYDGDRNLKAVGQYVTNEGKESKFIDLELADSKIVKTSQPIDADCKKEIEEVLTYYKGKVSGKSAIYEDLIDLGKESEYHRTFISKDTWRYGGFWFGIPASIPLLMYLISVVKRKKRNAYNKTRLKDL